MRLFMDGRYLRTDYHDGISRYSYSLIHAVAAMSDPTVLIHNRAQRDLLPDNVNIVEFHAPTSAREPLSAITLNRYKPDIVFSPMQTIGSVGRNFGLILTLHDLIYYQHRSPPRDLPQAIRGLWYLYHLTYLPQRMLLNGADAVATVSRTSQRLIRKHHLTSRPVRVIANAAPETSPRDPTGFRDKTLIYMGSFMEYKNVETIISALQYLPGYRLHLCSPISSNRRDELVRQAQLQGIGTTQLQFHNGIDDTEYHRLLRSATALVTTSRSEGYGLPLVEAMAVGTPVVVSDLEIFQEVGGQHNPGAQFVDITTGTAARQLAHCVMALEDNRAFIRASTGAVRQANTFRWSDSALELLKLAEEIHLRRSRRKA